MKFAWLLVICYWKIIDIQVFVCTFWCYMKCSVSYKQSAKFLVVASWRLTGSVRFVILWLFQYIIRVGWVIPSRKSTLLLMFRLVAFIKSSQCRLFTSLDGSNAPPVSKRRCPTILKSFVKLILFFLITIDIVFLNCALFSYWIFKIDCRMVIHRNICSWLCGTI